MPFFVDAHPAREVPIKVLLANLKAARAGQADPTGVRPVDYCLGSGGRVTCILEATDAAAVRQFHAAVGLPCRYVRQVAPPSEPA